MIRFNDMTPERLACLRVVETVGGRIDHEHPALAPFLDVPPNSRYIPDSWWYRL